MAWRLFNWGSRGEHYETVPGVYVMAHIFIPKCIQGTLFAVENTTGQQLLHVFDFEAPAAVVNIADCQAVCNILSAWWGTTYRSHVSNDVSAVRAVAVGRDQFEGATYELAMSTPGLESTGDRLPAEVTLSIKYAGSNIGRSRRGRHYVFPQRTSSLDLTSVDQFSVAARDALVADFSQLLVTAAGSGYPLRIASNRRVTLYPITHAVAVDRIVDRMGRRTLSHGR